MPCVIMKLRLTELQAAGLTTSIRKTRHRGLHGKSSLAFVIGGSLGLSEEVLKRADEKLSFSKMTFPHQLARIMLLEQIYRGFKIKKGENYHK